MSAGPATTAELLGRADPDVTFVEDEAAGALRDTARRFLAEALPTERVRSLMDGAEGFDPDDWTRVVELGWAGLAVPEELGGAGLGWAWTAVLAAETGPRLSGLPLLSSAVMATATLREVRGEADGLLAGLADGSARATLAHRPHLPGEQTVELPRFVDGTVTGTCRFVLDGATADRLLLVASSERGPVLVAADTTDATHEQPPLLDATRRQVHTHLDAAAATVLATGDDALAAVEAGIAAGAVFVANEQVGTATHVLRESVEYGRSRKQFGRAIGSFQALKHRMADTLKEVEAARSVALHAAKALDDDPVEARVAVPMAVSWCGEVAERATANHVQNLGGIGFTWEHDAHLHLKRAKSAKLLFGSPSAWRRVLADELGL